jgi:hypothetical protein
MRVGFGKVPANARVDSIEVDSAGMRIILKLPVPMRQNTHAITTDVMKPKPKALLRDKSANPPTSKSRRKILALNGPKTPVVEPRVDVQPQQAAAATDPATRPIFIGMDNGRVKPFVAAVSTCGYQEPKSVVFTRKRYYHEMKHGVHQRWEQHRVAQPEVRAMLRALTDSGGTLACCDPVLWRSYLEAEAPHRETRCQEYVLCRERALWRMRLFRKKRGSIDRAATKLVQTAVRPDGVKESLDRPLIVGRHRRLSLQWEAGRACGAHRQTAGSAQTGV